MNVRRRFFRVAKIFLGIILDFNREFRLISREGFTSAQKRMAPRHEKRARQLYSSAVDMGGMLIKLCQFFSARRDIFPEPYIRILSQLQDNVPPVPFNEIEKVLRHEYAGGVFPFVHVEEEPLASASLGQVHRARLSDGREVVIKIMKPGIERVIDIDSAILHRVFSVFSRYSIFSRRVDLLEIIEEFIRVTGDELNFRREVFLATSFKKSLGRFAYLSIPEVYPAFCTNRVIVMEFLEGDKIHDRDSWLARNNDPRVIACNIIEIYMEQFFSSDYIHYDPHPGNILVTDNNNLVLLDFGMAGRITPSMRRDLVEMMTGFVRRDSRLIVEVMDRMGFIRKGINRYSLTPVVQFFIDEVIDEIRLDREAYYAVDFSPIVRELVDLVYNQPVVLPVEWAFISKTLGVLIGIISGLYPDIHIYDELKPYAERLMKEDSSRLMKENLKRWKDDAVTALQLPRRIDNFVESLEHGYYRIPVDYTEIIDKVDEIKIFLVRLISFTISSFSIVSAYIAWRWHLLDLAILFFVISLVALVVCFLFKRNTMKDRLMRYMQ